MAAGKRIETGEQDTLRNELTAHVTINQKKCSGHCNGHCTKINEFDSNVKTSRK